jgi:hypothetical protein
MAGKIDYQRLKTSVDGSFRKLGDFRSLRFNFIQQFVGYNYSKNGTKDRVPVNMMELAINIYTRKLVARNPKVLVTPTRGYNDLLPAATNLGLAINHVIDEIKLKKTLQRVVVDAMFGMGIVKKGLTPVSEVNVDGQIFQIGQPYIEDISMDDFVFDMWAKKFSRCTYMGNRYKIPYEDAVNSGIFNQDVLKKIQPKREIVNRQSSEGGYDPKASSISTGNPTFNDEEFLDYIELIDLWLPFNGNKFITMPYSSTEDISWTEPLMEEEFQGPEGGPYDILTFEDVPDQIIPLPPASKWLDLHELANNLMRKFSKQAKRQKTILAVRKGSGKDGQKIVEAEDGEAIGVSHPENCQEYKFGGVDNVGLTFYLQVKQLQNYFAGNLDSLGGLSAVTETATQDKLLSDSANEMINGMKDEVYEFTKKCVKSLGWYLWYDPFIDIPLTKPVKGTNLTINTRFTSEDKEGDFLDYNFDIVPFSLQDDSPSQKIIKLNAIMQNYILPLQPMFQAQGAMIDVQELTSLLSSLNSFPELERLIIFTEPNAAAQQNKPIGDAGSKFSHRVYERVNRPGATRAGQDTAATQALMSGLNGGNQEAQAAAMMGGSTA